MAIQSPGDLESPLSFSLTLRLLALLLEDCQVYDLVMTDKMFISLKVSRANATMIFLMNIS